MKIKFRKMLLCLTSILALGIFMGGVSVKAESSGDMNSYINPIGGSGCSGKDSCWLYLGENKPLYGIRISIVDKDGNLVSGTKSMDYLGRETWTYKINNNTSYYRYTGPNVNRLAYIKGQASSTAMSKHDGTTIAAAWENMPDIFNSNDAVEKIETAITSMSEETLNNMFFDKDALNYNPQSSNLENHYMIIEPITAVSANGKKIYYGTYYELTKELIGRYNYQNSNNSGQSWIASVLDMKLPLSLYIEGNPDISIYDANSGSYFNGNLLIAKDSYLWYQSNKKRWRVKTDNIKNSKLGYGVGIISMSKMNIKKPTCDYNNASHFTTTTSGPGGIDCCEYALDNIDDYGKTKAELFSTYPRCGNAANANRCNARFSFNGANCGGKNTIEVKDHLSWECMWSSAYSNDETWRGMFLKYGDIDTQCSVYCANWVDLEYPNGSIDVLAGNRFSISNESSNYVIGVNPESNTPVVTPATLGPIMSKVTRNCTIVGEKNTDCLRAIEEEVSKIEPPALAFEYDSVRYENPKMDLDIESSAITETYVGEIYYRKVLTTYYKLPEDTYKYVSRQHGVSYKTNLQPNDYNIGPHAPVHFGETGETNYKITIDKFNIEHFDTYIKNGTKIAGKFETTIETYIQRLIERLTQTGKFAFKNINGIYYLSDSFTELLKKKYTIDNFLSMSCANTDKYSCSSDGNGIYCIGKEPNANPEDTYNHFRTCINNFVKNIKFADKDFSQSLEYTCNFNVIEGPGDPNINVIFRPISLNNPFPGSDGEGRDTGFNWSFAEDFSVKNPIVTEVITNNRGVKTENIYKELDPLYKITLTPALIKRIREYNKDNPYVISDDDAANENALVCTNDKCLSPFIRDEDKFKNEFTGCGITNTSVGLACESGESW